MNLIEALAAAVALAPELQSHVFDDAISQALQAAGNHREAFLRRFQAVVHFPKPSAEDRLRIWRKIVPNHVSLEDHVNLGTPF